MKKHSWIKDLKKLIILVIVLILAWFVWSRALYSHYSKGMEKTEFSNVIVNRYAVSDEDYSYSVKYPDFLSLTGNLAVSSLDEEESVMAFIIWPRVFNSKKYGLIINYNDSAFQIYTDLDGNAQNPEYQSIIDENAEGVEKIINAADAIWNLRENEK